MKLTYSSNPRSELNTARWYWQLARTMRRYANKGYGSLSAATRHWNIARARLMRAITGKAKAEQYCADYTTTIKGIPCGIVITGYQRPEYNNHGHPDSRLPDEPEDVEFFVVDRNGYRADWLADKVGEVKLWHHVLDMVNGFPVRGGV